MKQSTLKASWLPLAIVVPMAVMLGCQASSGPRSAPATAQCPSSEQGVQSGLEGVHAENSNEAVAGVQPIRYEDAITGGHVFQMYCAACHNARPLGERPFASYENAANHMRVRANLTGEEYRKLMVFLRYWHDIPPQTPPVEPSPKRFIFSQPLSELRPEPIAPSPEEVVPLPVP